MYGLSGAGWATWFMPSSTSTFSVSRLLHSLKKMQISKSIHVCQHQFRYAPKIQLKEQKQGLE